MYWLPLLDRIGNRPKSSVNSVARGTTRKVTWLVGAVIASISSSDGSMLLVALAASSAFAAVAHLVDLSPFWTCVWCPMTVGVALVGQYLATFSTLSPGNER
jgi:hypothetical protein